MFLGLILIQYKMWISMILADICTCFTFIPQTWLSNVCDKIMWRRQNILQLKNILPKVSLKLYQCAKSKLHFSCIVWSGPAYFTLSKQGVQGDTLHKKWVNQGNLSSKYHFASLQYITIGVSCFGRGSKSFKTMYIYFFI